MFFKEDISLYQKNLQIYYNVRIIYIYVGIFCKDL